MEEKNPSNSNNDSSNLKNDQIENNEPDYNIENSEQSLQNQIEDEHMEDSQMKQEEANDQNEEIAVGISQKQDFENSGDGTDSKANFSEENREKSGIGKWIIFIILILIIAITSFLFIKSDFFNRGQEVTITAPLETPETKPEEEDVHYLGILPLNNPSEMINQFSALEKYLNENTDLNIKLKFYPTSGEVGGYTALVREIVEGDISFAYLAAVTIVQANGNNEKVIPFTCAQKKGSPTYKGDLVVKIDSPYNKIEDLKGKKVSGTSKSSTSGSLMPLAWLKSIGIDPTTYFDGGLSYLGSHDKATEAVIRGTVDGAFINEATKNKFNKEGEVIRSIWRHEPVPEFPFVVNTEKVTPAELEKMKNALLVMHEKNLAGIQLIEPGYEKWVEIKWEDYLGTKTAVDNAYGPIFYNLDEWSDE